MVYLKYLLFLTLIPALTQNACISNNDLNKEVEIVSQDSIMGIEITQTFPRVTMEGKVKGYDTPWIRVYFFKGMEMYQIPYTFQDNSGKPVERNCYFIWKDGKDSGLQYYLGDSSSIKVVRIDSAIKEQWPYLLGRDTFVNLKEHGKLVSNNAQKDKMSPKSLYSFDWMKGEIPMKGTTLLSYSKRLQPIRYSFYPELDTVPGMKLYRIDIKNESKYLKDYKLTFDEVNTFMKFEIIQNLNYREIRNLFEQFEHDTMIYL